MKARFSAQALLLMSASLLSACGGGGGGDCTPSGTTTAPSAPSLSLSVDLKQLEFSWPAVSGADYYRFYENADGVSGYSQVGGDLPAGTTRYDIDVSVHEYDWANARYLLEACNSLGCTASAEVTTSLADAIPAIGYFKASNTGSLDSFGDAVAISGDGNTMAVGAGEESSNATGINGDQSNDLSLDSGAAYVFVRDAVTGDWSQQAYVKASNTGGLFGRSVALSADGNTLAVSAPAEDSSATGVGDNSLDVGAPGAGAVYVFVRSGNTWTQQAYVKASNTDAGDQFGSSVALSANGNTLAVGASFEDSNGTESDNSVSDSGAVYVFSRSGATWTQDAYIKASTVGAFDRFGESVDLSVNGNTLVVGAPREDSAATGVDGDESDNSQLDSGAAYVFERVAGAWSQQAYLKPSNTGGWFGSAVASSADGSRLAIGAPRESGGSTGVNGDQSADPLFLGSGAVYIFAEDSGSGAWAQEAYVKASNTEEDDEFGSSLALNGFGDLLAVGAPWEESLAAGVDGDQTNGTSSGIGAVYVFERSGSSWSQQTYAKPSNTYDGFIGFGRDVSLADDGLTMAIGAHLESSTATGINGDSSDTSATGSGAAYLY